MSYNTGMKLIVGLGNPGPQYTNNRHNIGWQVMDMLAEKWRVTEWQAKYKGESDFVEVSHQNEKILLLKPQTFMNNSGKSVRNIFVEHSQLTPKDLLVVHDDWAFSVGEYKFSYDRGANSHNGVQSVINSLGMRSFWRLRVGIAYPGWNIDFPKPRDFVLSDFSRSEKKHLSEMMIGTLRHEIIAWLEGKIN